jgi:hypothetical protein
MRSLRKQRGFLLNPYRFAGTTQSGAFTMGGVGTLSNVGASLASAPVSSNGAGALMVVDSNLTSGAFSIDGAAVSTMVGASLAGSAVSAVGAGVLAVESTGAAVACDAADFDGTNDYIARTSAFVPAATDSKKGTISFWFKADGATPVIIDTDQTRIQVDWNLTSANKFNVFANQGVAPFSGQLWLESNAHAAGSWYHFLCSWDAATAGARHIYVNDVASLAAVNTFANVEVDWSGITAFQVGDIVGTGFKVDGGIAEVYFAPGHYFDLSVEANRRKFISATGKPVSLGATGAIPTGSAPLVYLHLDDGESANNFAINRSAAGNFTVTGALTTYASSPSD